MNETCSNLIEIFHTPHTDYGPVMMWFWNDAVTEERITWQLEKFREQNITNFFVHPASGFDVPYLSDRYMELIQYVVKEAKRLGMYYWIYDEYEYPSGTAGGMVLEQYPHFRQKELKIEDRILGGPGTLCTVARPGDFIGAQFITELDGEVFAEDITSQCKVEVNGKYTEVTYLYDETNIAGRAFFYFSEYNMQLCPSGTGRFGSDVTLGYIDMFNPDAVGKFIEMTHERYKQFIGDEFGKTVRGVFTDEPTTLRHFDLSIAGPWSDTFPQEFEKDHGYSILPWLYTLWNIQPKRPEEIKAVHDYRSTIKRLYHDNFMRQYSSWCRENNLIFTGHFGGEEFLTGHLSQGDMLEELMLFDVPGLDSIISTIKIDWPEFNSAAKLSASAAKFCGSDRVLCETYTGSGWYARMTDLQRIANRLMLLGVNWIQFMGAHYSNEGAAKTYLASLPPQHSFANTLFRQYRELGRYMASFSALSAATKPDSQALVFIPLFQQEQDFYLWFIKKWGEFDEEELPQNRHYLDTINALLEEGIGFDLFSENLVDQITVHDGYVEAYGYRYNALIFPRMSCINTKTKALLDDLKAHNVKTVFTRMLPGINVDTGEHFDHGYDLKPWFPAANVTADGCTYFIQPGEFPWDMGLYRTAFREVLGGKVLNICADTGVYIAKRTNAHAEVYFILNDNKTSAAVSIDALPGMRLLTHDTFAQMPYTVENGRMSFVLNGYEMIAIVRDPDSQELPVSRPACPKHHSTTVEGPYEFTAADGNYLPLTFEMFHPLTGDWDPCKFQQFSDRIHLPRQGAYKLRARVQIDALPDSIKINAEVQRVTRLAVNGTELDFCGNCIRWSNADFTTEIAHLLHTGENLIELDGYTERIRKPNSPPYVYLSGDFCVSSDHRITAPVKQIPANGWEKAGFPFYCGDGIYRCTVTPEEGFRKTTLTIHTEDAARVYVNGVYAGQKLWIADELDLTEFLKPGENEIEIHITSTRQNMFTCEIGALWYYADRVNENGVLKPMELHYYS